MPDSPTQTCSSAGVPQVVVLPALHVRQLLGGVRYGGIATGLSRLVLQPGWSGLAALGGPMVACDPAAIAVQDRSSTDRDGIPAVDDDGALLLLAAERETVPVPDAGAGDGVWDAWLLARTPPLRHVSRSARPAVAAVCMHGEHVSAAMFRRSGDRGPPLWHPLRGVMLAGAGERRLGSIPPEPAGVPDVPGAVDAGRHRYSRIAGALGSETLARLQGCGVAVVGVGLLGSVLVHDLVRMGVRRVLGLDPGRATASDQLGDVAAGSEGLARVDALRRFVSPILQPGAELDLRSLPVDSPVAGTVLADLDVLVCATDDPLARWWAQAWALALNRSLMLLALRIDRGLARGHVAMLPAGSGCLACTGLPFDPQGLAARLRAVPAWTRPDVREERPMTRSWPAAVAHLALRRLELHIGGRIEGASIQEFAETADGALRFTPQRRPGWRPIHCILCHGLAGTGTRGLTPARLLALLEASSSQVA
jgi:hypothetical protein